MHAQYISLMMAFRSTIDKFMFQLRALPFTEALIYQIISFLAQCIAPLIDQQAFPAGPGTPILEAFAVLTSDSSKL